MQRNQNSHLTSPVEAEAYMKLARGVIDTVLTNRKGAALWWIDEEKHRHKYGLTTEHENELIEKLKTKFPKGNQNA